MDIILKIEKILPVQSFVSKKDNTTKNKYYFVGKTNGIYPDEVCMLVWGDENWQKLNIQVGKTYNLSFDARSREYNERWYTDLVCWKAINVDAPQPTPQATTPAITPAAVQTPTQAQPFSNSADDLPF